VSPEERRRKRLELWQAGHCCSNWYDCAMCLERKAVIDAKYPPESGVGDGGRQGTLERTPGEAPGNADRHGAADQGGTQAPPLE
jgi:hypothetical protein